jgi:hypothetical protein
MSHRSSSSQILNSLRKLSLRILTIFLTVVKFQTSSHQMRKLQSLKKLVQEQEKPIVERIEIKCMHTLSRSAERTSILHWHFLQLVNNSETDADSSQVSSTVAQSIGTMPGHLMLYTQLPTDNTWLTK